MNVFQPGQEIVNYHSIRGPCENRSGNHGRWFDPGPEMDIVAQAPASGKWQENRQ